MNLKKFLKVLKLNESTINVALGALIVFAIGMMVFNYFKDNKAKDTSIPGSTKKEDVVKIGEKYTVQPGDNLWVIAEKAYGSGYNWVDIAKENKITNPNQIETGDEVLLPDVEAKTQTASKETVEEKSVSGDSYTVTKGDSLWSIALKTYGDGYKWVDIARENKLVNPNLIHPGNMLTLPR